MGKLVRVASLRVQVGVQNSAEPALAAESGCTWTRLDDGEQHWYTLEYTGHHEFERATDDDEEDEAIWIGSNIDVRLNAEPEGGATFKVLTPEQIQQWQGGEDLQSVGQGTENEYDGADLSWSGNFGEPGTYFLIVEQTPSAAGPVYYTLEIDGEDVTYTVPDAADEMEDQTGTEESEMAAVPAAISSTTATGGTGPGDAAAPMEEWVSIPAGEALWYAFDYHGHHLFPEADDDEDKPDPEWVASQIDVWLDSNPDQSVSFSIWTTDNVGAWVAGEEVEPVGTGTASDYDPGDLNWSGAFESPGPYYVVVENVGTDLAQFLLNITGEDISF